MPLFEIEVENRVVRRGLNVMRITGTQGKWYREKLLEIADSEEMAKQSVINQIKQRRIFGLSAYPKREYRRQIKIIDIRRIA